MDPLLVTGGCDNKLVFWHAARGKFLKSVPFPQSHINCLVGSSDCAVVCVGGYCQIRAFDVRFASAQRQEPLVSYEGHTGNVTALGYDADRKFMYSASEDGTARIWDTRSSFGHQYVFQNEAPLHCAVLHPNGKLLLLGSSTGEVLVWDLMANRQLQALATPANAIQTMAMSVDGHCIAVAGFDETIHLCRCRDGTLMVSEQMPGSNAGEFVTRLCFAPNGLLASACSDSVVRVWTPESLPPGHALQDERASSPIANQSNGWEGQRAITDTPRITPQGASSKASSGQPSNDADSTVTVEPPSNSGPARFLGHSKWVWDLAFSNDGTYLASAGSDATARLWNTSTNTSIVVYSGVHTKAILAVALLDPIASGSEDSDLDELYLQF